MKHLLTILLLFYSLAALSQGNRCFRAYDAAGNELQTLCVGQEVRFQDCGDQVPDENEYYVFDYTSGSPIPTPSQPVQRHTYTAPGVYRVLQIANYGGATLTDTVSQVFEVKATPAPVFEVIPCSQNNVTVNITDTNYDSYTVNFGQGQEQTVPQGSSATFAYGSPGTYAISVTGNYTGATCTSAPVTQQVQTLSAAPAPFIRTLTVTQQATSGEIQFNLEQLQPGYNYMVEQWQGPRLNFVALGTITAVSQTSLLYTLRDVNTTMGVRYRVRPLDACGNVGSSSNIVSAIALTVTSDEGQAELEWESFPPPAQFEVYRNNSLIQTLDNTASTYTDTEVRCGQSYRYYLRGLAADGSISVSATREVNVSSTVVPAAPELFTTFDLNNNVVLTLLPPQGEEVQQITVERSLNGGGYTSLASASQAQYTDEAITPQPVCYRATFSNGCNTSPLSNVSCPVILQAQRLDNGSVSLSWSAYESFRGGAGRYEVELIDEGGNVLAGYAATGTTFTDRTPLEDRQLLRYRIRATSPDGTFTTFSNIAPVEQEALLFIPSAFTPNGDGLNDLFEVKGKFFSDFSMIIYNGSGNVVFTSADAATGWDGTYNGERMPAGAYAYLITVKTTGGAEKRRTGTVTLLR